MYNTLKPLDVAPRITNLSRELATSNPVKPPDAKFVFVPPGTTSDIESATNVVLPAVTLASGTRRMRDAVSRYNDDTPLPAPCCSVATLPLFACERLPVTVCAPVITMSVPVSVNAPAVGVRAARIL